MTEADHDEHLGSWVDVQVLGRHVLSLRRDPSELERDAELARAIAEAAAGVLDLVRRADARLRQVNAGDF
jgi:hypothetical protein